MGPFRPRAPRRALNSKIKPGWPLLVLLLLLVNGYLFLVRGLPDSAKTDGGPAGAPPAPGAPAPPPGQAFVSPLGEMRGVAGVRLPAEDVRARLPRSADRYDLESAAGVAGLRAFGDWCQTLTGRVERNENLSLAMQREGIEATIRDAVVAGLRGVLDFRRCREGDEFVLWRTPQGRLFRFSYRPARQPEVAYRVERREGKLSGRREVERLDVAVESIAIPIEGSLYQSLEEAGERPALVMLLVDIFAWDIDFYSDTRRGDVIRLLVEKHRLDGKFLRYGTILAAEYRGFVGVHRAFHFTWNENESGYFDENGGSLRKAFLKSPLKFVRITSGYGQRVHPILGYSAMHAGIDFGAPVGTPIWAPADGTVLFAGYKGANGNLVQLRHANGYETAFAHLQAIAREVRPGARVRQKQVIGWVGNTGMSTGPHLHYAMRKNGTLINPLAQKFPPADPVPPSRMADYRKTIAPLIERLKAIPLPTDAGAARAAGPDKASG